MHAKIALYVVLQGCQELDAAQAPVDTLVIAFVGLCLLVGLELSVGQDVSDDGQQIVCEAAALVIQCFGQLRQIGALNLDSYGRHYGAIRTNVFNQAVRSQAPL